MIKRFKRWYRRKLWILGIKLTVRTQNMAVVSGMALWYYGEGRSATAISETWKGYQLTMMESMDAYIITHIKYSPGAFVDR